MNSRRILITGGGGFIGSALAGRLVDDGHDVSALDDFSRGKPTRLSGEVAVLRGDIRDAAAVRNAVHGSDTIFHLAYLQGTQTFYEEPRKVIDVALTGIMNLLHACEECEREGNAKELVLVSSSEAYQVPPDGMVPTDETVPLSVPDVTNSRYSYGGGKIASEIATLAYSQASVLKRAVIVRPHNIYGPDMGNEHVIPQLAAKVQVLAEGEPLKIQGTGQETRSFCHISDCVQALAVVLEHGEDRTVYHIGTPEETRIRELARMIAKFYGVECDIRASELPQGSPPRRCPDITRLRALGFEPWMPLEDGLKDTLSFYAYKEAA